jgi:hypothetical protein
MSDPVGTAQLAERRRGRRDLPRGCAIHEPLRYGAGMTFRDSDARIRRAFDAAFRRFCEADSFEGQEDELSNMLHHLFRLVEVRGGIERYEAERYLSGHAAALVLMRHKDTHKLVQVTEPADVFGDYFTNMFGRLVWNPPPEVIADNRYLRYDAVFLKGRTVLDTLRAAYDAVESSP